MANEGSPLRLQRPSQIRQMLEDDDMPVYDAPDDDGAGAPRQSYNFAPGYHGIVYRADVPDWGAGPARGHRAGDKDKDKGKDKGKDKDKDNGEAKGQLAVTQADSTGKEGDARGDATGADTGTTTDGDDHDHDDEQARGKQQGTGTHYILQSMKWGLIPFWTKRSNPDYRSTLKTINCRADSLAQAGGMWATMKARKRCIVVAQGFYEWLKPARGGDKVPHFVRRTDGRLMCFAGLWDCVRYEGGEREGAEAEGNGEEEEQRGLYTYTVITTDSNEQLRFLHDRMPVILDQGSEALRTWLDPGRYEWSKELQALLKPYAGALEVYPVTREVGKVGNNSPSFIIPVASKENKSNIANFFANAAASSPPKKEKKMEEKGDTKEEGIKEENIKVEPGMELGSGDAKGEQTARETADAAAGTAGTKREASSSPPRAAQPPAKKGVAATSPARPKVKSATSNTVKGAVKGKKGKEMSEGSQKITKFFSKGG